MTGVNRTKFFRTKTDPRIKIYTIKKNNKSIKYPAIGFNFDAFLYFSNLEVKAITSTVHTANTLMFSITAENLKYWPYILKLQPTSLYFLVDLTYHQNYFYINHYACYLSQQRVMAVVEKPDYIESISFSEPAAVWLEREVNEFSTIKIKNLADSRRLLTDYTSRNQYDTIQYKTTSYSTVTGDLYYN